MKGEGEQQDYGMRIYDPRIAKFLSVDPLTPKYPELTPYQFASNRPIEGIDLDGMEFLSYKAYKNNSPWTIISKDISARAKRFSSSRAGRVFNGAMNTTFGAVGTIGSVVYIVESGGTGAALGGVVALDLSIGETAIGIAQLADAFANKESKVPDVTTLPGLIAHGFKSDHVEFVDGLGGILPSLFTGGANLMKNPLGLRAAVKDFAKERNVYNALGLIDGIMDAQGFISSGYDELKKSGIDFSKVTNFTLTHSEETTNDDKTKTSAIVHTFKYSFEYRNKKREGSYKYSKQVEYGKGTGGGGGASGGY